MQFNKNEPRINDRIRKSPVRLIGAGGEQVGIISLDQAKTMAREADLDLVEVGATADPPVVRIMDWGKVKFERDKKARESRKKATVIDVKEVKFRPTIDEHDFEIKLNRAIKFLEKGKKVKVTVFFRYRQMRRPELGVQILDKVTELTRDLAEVETRSRLEGRQMIMILAPIDPAQVAAKAESKAKSVEARAAQAKAADAKAAEAKAAEAKPAEAKAAEAKPAEAS